MKPRLAAVLLLIVLAPLALIAWLGARLAREEREAGRRRVETLLIEKLRDVDEQIARFLDKRQREILAATEIDAGDPESLREAVRAHPDVSQIFALDAEGRLVHPPLPGATQAEREFVSRTRRIWEDKELLRPPTEIAQAAPARQAIAPPAAPALGQRAQAPAAEADGDLVSSRADGMPELAAKASFVQSAAAPPPAQRSRGWHVWYWEKGINLLAWRVDEQGRTIGAELDGARFLADLIAALPATDAAAPNPPDALISLVDQHGAPIYQWGGWRGETSAKPLASLPLGYPLSAWRMEYRADPKALFASAGGAVAFNFAAGGAALALALFGLAFYFYREHAREMLEALQRVSFVNQVSHELKTPLTNIRLYAELLEKDLGEGDDQPARRLRVIVDESQRLSRLIGNILAFSRQQRGKLALRLAPGRVDDAIRAAIEHYDPALRAKGIEIEFTPGASDEAMIDADAIEQILGNLFSNVEKYAAAGGKLEIESRQKDERITIVVADRGPGVPAAEREKIFQPFYRVSDKLTEGVAGAGIGLALARDLARLHGGDLVLAPQSEGARFELSITAKPRKED